MTHRLIAPAFLLVLTSAAPPPPAPFDLTSIMNVCGGPRGVADPDIETVLLPGYGQGGFPIRTAKPEAQAFFDNGLQLAHAFAHKATVAAFVEARRIDPSCAMCGWGEAYSKGPTINFGISDSDAEELAGIVVEARALARDGPEIERQLIEALGKRYPGTGVDHQAYADAMVAIAAANPASDALTVLAVEALMIAAPRNALKEHMPAPVALLETILARTPDYAPAIHFYIHATEGAGFAERALPYADKLEAIAPAASHLVHMPSHTYYWAGRYGDAGTANLRAVRINDANTAKAGMTEPGAAFTLGNYHWHNALFGVGGALMAGDAETGLAIARPLIKAAYDVTDSSYVQIAQGNAFVAVARFGSFEEMSALPDPGKASPIARVMWHYARGEAFARAGNAKGVKAAVKALRKRGGAPGEPFRQIALAVTEGRLAMLQGKPADAIAPLRRAAAPEETAPFGTSYDPPIWWFPVRRSLAAALLASGDATGALAEADTVLKRHKGDPLTLVVRAAALTALGRAAEAEQDMTLARKGWRGDPALLVARYA